MQNQTHHQNPFRGSVEHWVIEMVPRYVVFDDCSQDRSLTCTADQFANELRPSLSAVGVRVVRLRGARSNSELAGFQARGLARSDYETKHRIVTVIVDDIVERLAAEVYSADAWVSPT